MSARVRPRKGIGRRPTVNKTGNTSSGRVKAQQLLSEHAFVTRPPASSALILPWLTPSKASRKFAIGVYVKTKTGAGVSVEPSAEIRDSSGALKRVPSERWTITGAWAIHGLFISENAPISAIRLRMIASRLDVDLYLWGYAGGPFRDLGPRLGREIREVDPEVDEQLLAGIIAAVRTRRFKYLESAYLFHAPNTLPNGKGCRLSREPVTCKYCSLCERLLPIVSFHHHSAFESGYQQECRACKNCNINPKLNYRRTKQQGADLIVRT